MKEILITMALTLALMSAPARAETDPGISYDRSSDELSLQVTDMPLSELLARIAAFSGLDIRMDPSLEQPITLDTGKRPLQDALESLARGYRLNYVMKHGPLKNEERALVAFHVLREGEMTAADLAPLLSRQYEAQVNLRRQARDDRVADERSWQRWKARFDRVPEGVRRKMEEKFEKRMKRKAQKAAEQAENDEKKREREEEKQALRQHRETELRERNPERYQLRQERRQALRQQLIDNNGELPQSP